MFDTKLDIQRIEKWRKDSCEFFKNAGLRPCQYEDEVGELADKAVQKIIRKASQYLIDFETSGPNAMTERYGGCRATAYNRRAWALDQKSKASQFR